MFASLIGSCGDRRPSENTAVSQDLGNKAVLPSDRGDHLRHNSFESGSLAEAKDQTHIALAIGCSLLLQSFVRDPALLRVRK